MITVNEPPGTTFHLSLSLRFRPWSVGALAQRLGRVLGSLAKESSRQSIAQQRASWAVNSACGSRSPVVLHHDHSEQRLERRDEESREAQARRRRRRVARRAATQ
ncbi:MAG: hypothetical protein WCJ35_23100 [Planctomycetota bacterium]